MGEPAPSALASRLDRDSRNPLASRDAKGGLSSMADIDALCAVEGEGVEGVIAGRAIYSGDLDFAAAQARADELGA